MVPHTSPLLFLGSPRIQNVRTANSRKRKKSKLNQPTLGKPVGFHIGTADKLYVVYDTAQQKIGRSHENVRKPTAQRRQAHSSASQSNAKPITGSTSKQWTHPPLKQLHTVHTFSVCAPDKKNHKNVQINKGFRSVAPNS